MSDARTTPTATSRHRRARRCKPRRSGEALHKIAAQVTKAFPCRRSPRHGCRTRWSADRTARGRRGAPARGVPAWLRRRRQRPDRDRPRLAGPDAERRVRVAARAVSMRPVADRPRVVSAHRPGAERALARRLRRRADPRPVPRRRAQAPQPAAVGAGAGRLQPGHHDGAACRPAPRRRAVRRRRLFRHPGARPRGQARIAGGRDQVAAAGPADPWRQRRADPAARRCLWPPTASPRSACRSNGTFRPGSATESTRKGCARAANSSRGGSRAALPSLPTTLGGRFTILSPYPIHLALLRSRTPRRSRTLP